MNQINNPKFNPSETEQLIVRFIKDIFVRTHKTQSVIAVSGGIDSAVSLCLLSKALGKENVVGLMLPYADQNMEDAQLALDFCQIPESNRKTINIQSAVNELVNMNISINPTQDENRNESKSAKQKRLGNCMARVRMIVVYDWAAKLDALVCGTENKSEKYLGYFTRFGDQASDLEPLEHLYKTQVLVLAEHLGLPAYLIDKPPSAGLWPSQTDESELGFSYAAADQVLTQLVDQQVEPKNIQIPDLSQDTIDQVIARVDSQSFKLQVPYKLSELEPLTH